MNARPPVDGERVLFCRHADVSEDHINIGESSGAAQPFHWYDLGDNEAKRVDEGESFTVHWLAICDRCHRRANPASCMSASDADLLRVAAKDAPWIGEPPVITVVV